MASVADLLAFLQASAMVRLGPGHQAGFADSPARRASTAAKRSASLRSPGSRSVARSATAIACAEGSQLRSNSRTAVSGSASATR